MLSALELSLTHVDRSIDVMKREQAKYNLDAAEISAREGFLNQAKARLVDVTTKVNAPATRAVLESTVRTALLNSRAASRRAGSDRFAKLEEAREASNQDFLDDAQRQVALVRQQHEAGLDSIARSVSDVKAIASAIGKEVEESNVALDALHEDVDRVEGRMQQQMAKLDKLLGSIKDKGSMCTILILVAILILLLVLIITWK